MRYITLKPIKTAEEKRIAAKLPRISKATLAKLIADPTETKVISPSSAAASGKRTAALRESILADLGRDLKGVKHPMAAWLKLTDAKRAAAPVIKANATEYRLMSLNSLLTDAFCLAKLNQNSAYALERLGRFHKLVEKNVVAGLTKTDRNKLKKLSPVPGLAGTEVQKRMGSLVELLDHWRPTWTAPVADLVNFSPEDGENGKTDQSPVNQNCPGKVPNPKGLVSVSNWPLRANITSVKDQGKKRGTCSAFGTVAAIESAASVKYGLRVNLSEQDLYKKQRLDWNPNLFDDYYDDGYQPLLSMLFQVVSGYVFPFENDWTYNQSPNRLPLVPDANRKYTHSCDGYGGLACSDTNHQAKRVCHKMPTSEVKETVKEVCEFVESIPFVGILGGWVCDPVTEFVEVVGEIQVCVYETNVPGNARIKATSFLPVWDPIWNTDILAATGLLRLRIPLIFCFTVPDSWKQENHSSVDGLGYVVYDPQETAPSKAGGHCVEMVGCVDNSELPASAGIQPGAGGGYFIVKNSWGPCWADMGFAYLPYEWVNKWGMLIVAIDNVERF